MANLTVNNFTQFVQIFARGVQSSAFSLVDFTVGSILRALAEAQSAVALWLQAMVLILLSVTRAATSTGNDLDTWMADWGFFREPALAATGQVTIGRNVATVAGFVPVGTVLRTIDLTQSFAVHADTTNAAYSVIAGGYVLAAGVTSVSITVQALSPGVAGNVQPGTIALIAGATTGLDYVTNPTAFENGIDAEGDASFRARFQAFIQGLRSAIPAAIAAAAAAVQQNVKQQLLVNTPLPGFYTLYADDGSGAAPDSFIEAVTAAVQAVTAEGVQPTVVRPTVVGASVNYSLLVASEAGRETSIALADAAVAAFIAALPIGAPLSYLSLPGVIIAADANITGLTLLAINGATSDLTVPPGSLITASAITGS